MTFLAFVAALAAAAAPAADPTAAALGPPKPAPATQPAPSVENVYWMVDCLLQKKNPNLERMLSTVPGTEDSEMAWLRTAISGCLVAEHPIPNAEFYDRGAVAERLLYRDFPSIGGAPRRKPAPLFPAVDPAYAAKALPQSLAALIMLDATSCVVRADPQSAYDYFRSQRGSADERARLSAMLPSLSACLTKDQPLKLTPPIFRAFLAEAAYRVAAGQPEVFGARP
ncbi:MAG: hypothetical protein QOK17_863 [Sphingomonadales bacterium]|jgi:hypothetical protein|nr:hypothetical protein [Sphingomonadales bacterium]